MRRDGPPKGGSEPPAPRGERSGGVEHPSTMPGTGPGGRPSRRRRWILAGCIAALLGVLTPLFAFGLRRDPSFLRSALVGHPAPAFSLRTLEGDRTVTLSDLRGQVVVVNFWASWCAACREEHPALVAAWQRYRDQGVVFVGIVFEDSTANALRFIHDRGSDGPQLLDPGGRTALAFGVYGIPETFFIGRDGVIRDKRVGASTYDSLAGEIERLLPGGGT